MNIKMINIFKNLFKETKMKHECTHRPLKFVKNVYYNLVLECRLYQCSDCHLQLLVDEKHKEEEKTAMMIEDQMKMWCIGCHTLSVTEYGDCLCDKCIIKKFRENDSKRREEIKDLKDRLKINEEYFQMKGMVTQAEFKEYKKKVAFIEAHTSIENLLKDLKTTLEKFNER